MFHIFTTKIARHLEEKSEHVFDKLVLPVALVAPFMTLPQVFEVWGKGKVDGVSVITWLGYALGSGLWVIYGLIHKEKPLTLANFLLVVFDISIVVGVLVHRLIY